MRGQIKYIAGEFTDGDITAGILPIAYIETVENPCLFVVFNSAVTSITQTFTVEKVDNNNSEINIGERFPTGTWKYRLLYT